MKMADGQKPATRGQGSNRLEASRNRRQGRTKIAAEEKSATPDKGLDRLATNGDRRPGRRKMFADEESSVLDQGPNRLEPNRDRRQRRWKVLRRVARILTQTPDDGSGLVEDTPFKKSGVAALMRLLEERMTEEDKPRTRRAKAIHRMLTEGDEGDSELIHGARVEQLQFMSRMIQRMRSEGPAGRRGRLRDEL